MNGISNPRPIPVPLSSHYVIRAFGVPQTTMAWPCLKGSTGLRAWDTGQKHPQVLHTFCRNLIDLFHSDTIFTSPYYLITKWRQ